MIDEDALRRVYQDDPDGFTRGEAVTIAALVGAASAAIVGLAEWFLWEPATNVFKFWFS
jgi:hypothetical protein